MSSPKPLPKETEIYWTRHLFSCANSLTDANKKEISSVAGNPHVSNIGLLHGINIMKDKKYFNDKNKIDLIICSQLIRTMETASIMFSEYYSPEYPIIVAPFINEESEMTTPSLNKGVVPIAQFAGYDKDNIPEDPITTVNKYSQYIAYQNKNKKNILQYNLQYVDNYGVNIGIPEKTDKKWFGVSPNYQKFTQILDTIIRTFITNYNINKNKFNIVVISHSKFIFKNIIGKKAVINKDITNIIYNEDKIKTYIENATNKHRYYYDKTNYKYYLSIYKKVYNGDIIKKSQFNNTIEYIQPKYDVPEIFIYSDFFKINNNIYDIGRKAIAVDVLRDFFKSNFNKINKYKEINYIVFGFCGFNDMRYRKVLTKLLLINKGIIINKNNKKIDLKIDQKSIDTFLNIIYKKFYNPLYEILNKDLKSIDVDTGRLKGKGEGGITPMIWFLKSDGQPDKNKIGKLLPKYFEGWDKESIEKQIEINMENRELIFYHNVSKKSNKEVLCNYIPKYHGICDYNSKKYFIMGDTSGKYKSYRKFDFKIGASTQYLSDTSMSYMRSLKDYAKVIRHLLLNTVTSYSSLTGVRLEGDSISTDVRPKDEADIKRDEFKKYTPTIQKLVELFSPEIKNNLTKMLKFNENDVTTKAKDTISQFKILKVSEKTQNKLRNPLNIIYIIKNRAPYDYLKFVENYLKFIDDFVKPNYTRSVKAPYSYAFIGSSLLITIGDYYSDSPEIEFKLIDFAHAHKWDNITDTPVLFNGEPLMTKTIFDEFLKNYTNGLLNIGIMLLALLDEYDKIDEVIKNKFIDFYGYFNIKNKNFESKEHKEINKIVLDIFGENKHEGNKKFVKELTKYYYNSLSKGGIKIKNNINKTAYYMALIKYFDDLLTNNDTFKKNVGEIINANNINKKCCLRELIKNPNINYEILIKKCPKSQTGTNNRLNIPQNKIDLIKKIAKNEENVELITYILLSFWSPIKEKGLQITSNDNKKNLEESYIKQFKNNVKKFQIRADKPLNKIRAHKIAKKRLVKSESASVVNKEAVEERVTN